jgi:NAD(P)-dependent dehydrogenase (short-subunit alcohol dehydrogenase family)
MSNTKPRVLITGASAGIGLELARDLAATDSVDLWLASRSERIFDAAKSLPTPAKYSRVDVGDMLSVASLFADISAEWSSLDAVVHCAAVLGPSGDFWKISTQAFMETVRVDLGGAYSVCREFVDLHIKQSQRVGGRGKIILFGGGGAGYGYPKFLPYGTSKAAIVRMCESMSMEFDSAGLHIDINVIAPGANATAMLDAVRAGGGEVRTVVPFSKPISLCRWLLSEGSDGVTGRFIHVNDPYHTIDASTFPSDALMLRRKDL